MAGNKRNNKSKHDPEEDKGILAVLRKIIVIISILMLTVFPFIIIIICISVAIYETASEKTVRQDKPETAFFSADKPYGSYLYLQKVNDNTYKVLSEEESADKRLSWDDETFCYYDDGANCYVYYSTYKKEWRYWYKNISSDYGYNGWMKYGEGGWIIEDKKGEWIPLPEDYDRSNMWFIDE